jgi:hypothetical protein
MHGRFDRKPKVEVSMAHLTYNIFEGTLLAQPERQAGPILLTLATSGASNHWWDAARRQHGPHGSPGHVCGGPIPPGLWRLHVPGSPHPDGGKHRPSWIPIGPVRGRTLLYIHPAGTLTEGCIAVKDHEVYEKIRELVRSEGGGTLFVIGVEVV